MGPRESTPALVSSPEAVSPSSLEHAATESATTEAIAAPLNILPIPAMCISYCRVSTLPPTRADGTSDPSPL